MLTAIDTNSIDADVSRGFFVATPYHGGEVRCF